NKSVCVIPFAFIMPKAVFSVGGIIGCWRFKKIADCASTRSWQANHWPHAAPPPESISKCAKAKIRPITPRCGQSSPTLEHRLLVCAPSAVALRCKTQKHSRQNVRWAHRQEYLCSMRTALGGVFSLVILSGAQRSRRISNYLSARRGPVLTRKSQALREKTPPRVCD